MIKLLLLQQYFYKFRKNSKVSLLDKSCILKAFEWDSVTERLTLIY